MGASSPSRVPWRDGSTDPARCAVTTVILAGGLGTRIGGAKGLRLLHGRMLIDWVLDAVKDQSEEILINANHPCDAYEHFGYKVVVDQTQDFLGPLAGVQSALRCACHDFIVSVPCDTPFLPRNLISNLFRAVTVKSTTEVAVAVVTGKRQPTIAIYRKSLLPQLDAYLGSGGRGVGAWLETLRVGELVLDDTMAFSNINTLDDLQLASQAHK